MRTPDGLTLTTVLLSLSLSVPAAADERGEPIVSNAGLASGAWPDAVEIDVPPAPAGTAPAVRLLSSHTTVDGILGSGWELMATSVLTRHSALGGVPGYTDEDLYRLDGEELVVEGDHYEPLHWDGSRLDYHESTNTWTRRMNGWTWTYGNEGTVANATQTLYVTGGRSNHVPFVIYTDFVMPTGDVCPTSRTACNTVAWHLSRMEDPFGNAVDITYALNPLPADVDAIYGWANNRHHVPSSMTYAGGRATVTFEYEERPDPRLSIASGAPAFMTHRLSEIETHVDGALYSRYVMEYLDEATTDCRGQAISPPDPVVQTILHRITRKGTTDLNTWDLRCLETHAQAPAWQGDDAAGELSGLIDSPTGSTTLDLNQDWALPISASLDGDGVTDLIVLGFHMNGSSHETRHRVYVATPRQDSAFADSAETGKAGDMAAAWEAEIAALLDNSHFNDDRGFAFGDLDKDGWTDLLYEDHTASLGQVLILDRLYDTVFASLSTSLDACDLRYGSLGDVDGDGRPDLIVRPHHGEMFGCTLEEHSRWIRNQGAPVWFDSATAVQLNVPLEADTPPSEWTDVVDGSFLCPGAVTWPTDYYDTLTTEAEFIANQARFGDFNDDGITDVAYALSTCWYQWDPDGDGVDNWTQEFGSFYSRIFWGDGYGDFIDSTLPAGAPVLYDSAHFDYDYIPTPRIVSGVFSTLDADRNGLSELLTSKVSAQGGPGTYGQHFRGLIGGFGLDAYESGTPAGYAPDYEPAALAYSGPGWGCYAHTVMPVFGDFDGDGFTDIITLEYHEGESFNEVCGTDAWCVVYRKNTRAAAQGRVESSFGPWGGETALTWGFSADEPHWNPDLPMNLEVIDKVNGPEGVVEHVYRGATIREGSPTVFVEVERTNERGQRELLVQASQPVLAGKPLHRVRYRADGTMEHVTVYVHGELDPGGFYYVTVDQPYFNPLVRQCDFELGFGRKTFLIGGGMGDPVQSLTLEELIDLCYEHPPAPGSPVDPEMMDGALNVAGGQFRFVMGHEAGVASEQRWLLRQQLEGGSFARIAFSASDVDLAGSWTLDDSPPLLVLPPPFLRWPVPDDLDGVVPDMDSAQDDYTYPGGLPETPYRFFLEDWTYSTSLRRLDRDYDHRDTVTTADDRDTSMTWQQPDPTGHWYRLTHAETTDIDGNRFRSIARDSFAGFDSAKHVHLCGVDPAVCVNHDFVYFADGEKQSHTWPDGTETWTRAWCGAPVDHTDAAGRVRHTTYDGSCRPIEATFEGMATTFDWGAFNLLIASATTVDGVTTTENIYRDLDFAYPEDEDFLEPRVARFRVEDGRLELEYADGFGRRTKIVRCWVDDSGGGTVLFGSFACQDGTIETVAWTLYGHDGLVKVEVGSSREGELPASTGFAHDHFGRVVVRDDPAHVNPGPAWLRSTTDHGHDWTATSDPLSRSHRLGYTTLSRDTSIDGVSRLSTVLDTFGRVESRTAADGLVTRYEYDTLSRVSRVYHDASVPCVDASGAPALCTWQREFPGYDLMGRVTEEVGPDGVLLEYAWDALGRPTHEWIDGVQVWQAVYTDAAAFGQPQVETTDETGAITVQVTDGLGRLISETLPGGLARTVEHGPNGQVVSIQDEDGLVHTFFYDVHDRLIEESHPATGTTLYARDGAGRVLSREDADGVVDEYSYVFSGSPFRHERVAPLRSAGDWLVAEYAYDDGGRVTSETAGGVSNEYFWDDLDRITEAWYGVSPAGTPAATVRLRYTDADLVEERDLWPVQGTYATTRYSYNDYGWLTSARDAAGGETALVRDAAGRLRRLIDAEGWIADRTYDARGRVIEADVPGGTVTRQYTPGATYGGQANLWRIDEADAEDELLGVASSVYLDPLGRVVARVERDGTAFETAWAGSRISSQTWLDASGAVVAQRDREYDDEGRIEREVGPYRPGDPEAVIYDLQRTYTAAGRLLTFATPDDTTIFSYRDGLLESESWFGQTRELLRGDPAAPWVTAERHTASGGGVRLHAYQHDRLGRIVDEVVTEASKPIVRNIWTGHDFHGSPRVEVSRSDGVEQVRNTWQYDPEGRPVARRTVVQGGVNADTGWAWYDNGVLRQVQTPSGETIAYDYGAVFDHQLDRVWDPVGGTVYAEVLARNLRGQITSLSMPLVNEQRDVVYDEMGRALQRSTGPIGGAADLLWQASYDPLGRLDATTISDTAAGVWGDDYDYDGSGRLVHEYHGRSATDYVYTLDRAGNRTRTEMDDGTTLTITDVVYDGPVATSVGGVALGLDAWKSVTADQHGNTYTRAADGHVSAVVGPLPPGPVPLTASARPVRDANGIPAAWTTALIGAAPRRTIWGLDPSDLPLEVVEPSGDVTTYITAGGLLLGTLVNGAVVTPAQEIAGTLFRDGSGTLGHATAFGEGAVAPVGRTEHFLFAHLEQVSQAPTVHFARLRTYDPATGRFLEPDPIGLAGGPQRYQYADGDPLQKWDPMGLTTCNTGDGSAPDLPHASLKGIIIDTDGVGYTDPFAEAKANRAAAAALQALVDFWSGFDIKGGASSSCRDCESPWPSGGGGGPLNGDLAFGSAKGKEPDWQEKGERAKARADKKFDRYLQRAKNRWNRLHGGALEDLAHDDPLAPWYPDLGDEEDPPLTVIEVLPPPPPSADPGPHTVFITNIKDGPNDKVAIHFPTNTIVHERRRRPTQSKQPAVPTGTTVPGMGSNQWRTSEPPPAPKSAEELIEWLRPNLAFSYTGEFKVSTPSAELGALADAEWDEDDWIPNEIKVGGTGSLKFFVAKSEGKVYLEEKDGEVTIVAEGEICVEWGVKGCVQNGGMRIPFAMMPGGINGLPEEDAFWIEQEKKRQDEMNDDFDTTGERAKTTCELMPWIPECGGK